jgi:hypothetical protein
VCEIAKKNQLNDCRCSNTKEIDIKLDMRSCLLLGITEAAAAKVGWYFEIIY